MEYFIARYSTKAGKKIRSIGRSTLDRLTSYKWPGIVRELRNVIERSVIVCDTENFTVDQSWLRQGAEETIAPSAPLFEVQGLRSGRRSRRRWPRPGGVSGPSGAATRPGIRASTLEAKIRTRKINKHRFKIARARS